jgi:hypothetical protein
MSDRHESLKMSRRSFMRVSGATIGSLAIGALPRALPPTAIDQVQPPEFKLVQINFGKTILRGTRDGRILESSDGGKTWQQVANFGKHCAVVALAEQRGQCLAQVEVQSFRFALTSTDARTWYTVQ